MGRGCHRCRDHRTISDLPRALRFGIFDPAHGTGLRQGAALGARNAGRSLHLCRIEAFDKPRLVEG